MGSIFHEARLLYLKLPVSLTWYRDCSISGKKRMDCSISGKKRNKSKIKKLSLMNSLTEYKILLVVYILNILPNSQICYRPVSGCVLRVAVIMDMSYRKCK